MNVVLTGATGFIGARLARQLVARGDHVTAIVRDPARAADLANDGIKLAVGDVTDASSLRGPFGEADAIYHVAGWYHLGKVERVEAMRVNVDGTRTVLEAMAAAGVARGVYTSSLAVNGDTHGRAVTENYQSLPGHWLSIYDESKWRAHHEVAVPMMEQGLPLVIVQPGLVYGPGDAGPASGLWRQFLEGSLRAIPARTAYAWGHVDDTAAGHIAALERGTAGSAYLLGGPNHTLTDAMALAARLTGRRPPRSVHPALLGLAGRAADAAGAVGIGDGGEVMRVVAGTTYIADCSRAARELGWQPRPLEDGLRTTLKALAAGLGIQLPAVAA